MVNINKMARSAGIGAGIGSAVGAVGGIIKASNDSEPDTSSNIVGSIVGGAIIGSIGGAGISAGRQYLQAKRLANAAGSDTVESAVKQASKVQKPTQSNVINHAQDLNVAEQISKASAGNTEPIRSSTVLNVAPEVVSEGYYTPTNVSYKAGYAAKMRGDRRSYIDDSSYDKSFKKLTNRHYYDHGVDKHGSDYDMQAYMRGMKDAIREKFKTT